MERVQRRRRENLCITEVEPPIVHDSGKGVGNGPSRIKRLISRDANTAKGGIPEQHSIGGIITPKREAGEALAFKLGTITRAAVIGNATERKWVRRCGLIP